MYFFDSSSEKNKAEIKKKAFQFVVSSLRLVASMREGKTTNGTEKKVLAFQLLVSVARRVVLIGYL